MSCIPTLPDMSRLSCAHSLFSSPLSVQCLRTPPTPKSRLTPVFSKECRRNIIAELSSCEGASSSILSHDSRISRRAGMLGAIATTLIVGKEAVTVSEAHAAAQVTVGSYLPKTDDGEFVQFTPGETSTPALRAGNVSPYSFILPPTWTQARIANILSGNYCQPKCAEPWIEVKFENPKQGTLQVVASPMVRLTNKPNSRIEDIGPPSTIISALGSFVTGDSFDPDEVLEMSIVKIGDQTYYNYVLETPFARSGTHNLATATAKGNTVLLLVVSANDSQWAANEKTLRKLAKSFSV